MARRTDEDGAPSTRMTELPLNVPFEVEVNAVLE
jgi:hypothetical protein